MLPYVSTPIFSLPTVLPFITFNKLLHLDLIIVTAHYNLLFISLYLLFLLILLLLLFLLVFLRLFSY